MNDPLESFQCGTFTPIKLFQNSYSIYSINAIPIGTCEKLQATIISEIYDEIHDQLVINCPKSGDSA